MIFYVRTKLSIRSKLLYYDLNFFIMEHHTSEIASIIPYSQPASTWRLYNVTLTSMSRHAVYKRRINVMTMYRRQLMLYKRHVPAWQ